MSVSHANVIMNKRLLRAGLFRLSGFDFRRSVCIFSQNERPADSEISQYLEKNCSEGITHLTRL
jgi:hypothetical protein